MPFRMKPRIPRLIHRPARLLGALAGLTLATTITASSAWAQDATLTVQVKQGVVRQSPTALGKVEARLDYGQRVVVLEKSGETWVKIRQADNATLTGWMRTGELTTRKLKLAANPGNNLTPTTARQSDIAMAGKGFNQQVEVDRSQNTSAKGYTLLKKIDDKPAHNVTAEELASFQQAGGVVAGEDAQ